MPLAFLPSFLSRPRIDERALDAWFDSYTGEGGGDIIDDDGIMKLSSELCIDIVDTVWFVIAWKMNAEEQGVFTREEWHKGMKAIG